jgi:aspartate/methionine/tyrosine aminotransferase
VSELGFMPSRELGERHPGLLAVGGHPVADMPAHVVEAASRAARRAAYAPTYGLRELRVAIAERVGVELGRPIDPDRQVLVTLGGMQGLHLAAAAFGSRAVCHVPSFFFPQVVALAGGACVRTGGADGRPDWEAFAKAIDARTTLAIVNTPVNPTGYVLRRHDLDALAGTLAGSDALLLSDEAYAGVLFDGNEHLSPASHPDLADRTLVLRSFSKTHGMAAWRVGFAVGPPEAIETLATAFSWQSLAIDAVAQAAALAALTGPQDWIVAAVDELAAARDRAIEAANATGLLRAGLPEAAAFVWAAVDGYEDAWCERLAGEYGIPAVVGRHFGSHTPHLRIPFGGRPEARAELIQRFRALAAQADSEADRPPEGALGRPAPRDR